MSHRALYSFAFFLCAAFTPCAFAQPDQQPMQETENPANDNLLSGTIVSLTTEERVTTLTVEVEGENHEFRITPQIQFQVQGPGDHGFLTEGSYIETRAVMTNDRLFPETLTVYVLGRGDRAPRGIIQPVQATGEVGENRYDISGTIAASAQDEQYPEYTQLAVRSAQDAVLFVREGLGLTVSFSGHERAAAGDPIEMQVMRMRNGRITLQAARVTKTEAFDSAAVLGAETEE